MTIKFGRSSCDSRLVSSQDAQTKVKKIPKKKAHPLKNYRFQVVLPPTVPLKTSFRNFSLSNKLDIPMYFKFEAPDNS